MNRLLFVYFLLNTSLVSAQYWARTFSHHSYSIESHQVILAHDSGFIIMGQLWDPVTRDRIGIHIIKTDDEGIVVWRRDIIKQNQCLEVASLARRIDSAYLIGGGIETDSFGFQFYLASIDVKGEVRREQSFGYVGNDKVRAFKLFTDGRFAICGKTEETAGSERDGSWVSMHHSSGDLIWSERFAFAPFGNGSTHDFIVTRDGGLAVTGKEGGNYDYNELYLHKFDSSGLTDCHRGWVLDVSHRGLGIDQSDDGGYIIAGFSTANPGFTAPWMIKTDSLANLAWDHHNWFSVADIPGPFFASANDVKQNEDGNYIFCGSLESASECTRCENNEYVGFLWSLDPSGAHRWIRIMPNQVNLNSCLILRDESIISSGRNDGSMYLLKTNPDGLTAVDDPHELNNNKVSISPNRSLGTSIIHLPHNLDSRETHIYIHSSDGKLIQYAPVSSSTLQLNTLDYPTGLYFITIYFDDQILYRIEFIKLN